MNNREIDAVAIFDIDYGNGSFHKREVIIPIDKYKLLEGIDDLMKLVKSSTHIGNVEFKYFRLKTINKPCYSATYWYDWNLNRAFSHHPGHKDYLLADAKKRNEVIIDCIKCNEEFARFASASYGNHINGKYCCNKCFKQYESYDFELNKKEELPLMLINEPRDELQIMVFNANGEVSIVPKGFAKNPLADVKFTTLPSNEGTKEISFKEFNELVFDNKLKYQEEETQYTTEIEGVKYVCKKI